jgi:WS/DGAT/MGAT family acyltransferase
VASQRVGARGVGAQGAHVDRLTPEDEVVLWPDAVWPQENCALLILESAPELTALRALVGANLPLEPRLRQRLIVPPRRLGAPLWVDDDDFQLDRHVRSVAVGDPGGVVELLARVEQVRHDRLDREHPLWDLTLLTHLAEGRAAILVRSHHVLADGVATVALFGRILAETTPDVVPEAWKPSPTPTDAELLADQRARRSARRRAAWGRMAHPFVLARTAVSTLRGLLGVFARIERHAAPSLNRTIGADRSLALVDLDLAEVAAAGHASEGTVNDVLLAMIGGGLRRLLQSTGAPTDELEVDVFVPVSLRSGADERANLIGEFPVTVPVGEPDARARLRLIAGRTRALKSHPHPSLGSLLGSRVAQWAFRRFAVAERHPVNITTADLRGPAQRLEIAGVAVVAIHPLVALIANITIAVAAVSFAGRLFVGIVADRETVPDLEPLAHGMRAELDALSDARRATPTSESGFA